MASPAASGWRAGCDSQLCHSRHPLWAAQNPGSESRPPPSAAPSGDCPWWDLSSLAFSQASPALRPRPGDLVMTGPACGCSLGLLSCPGRARPGPEQAAGEGGVSAWVSLPMKQAGCHACPMRHCQNAVREGCCLATDKCVAPPPLPLPSPAQQELGNLQGEGTAWTPRQLLPFQILH